MTERTLQMMDGTKINDCDAIYDETSLWIYCPLNMKQAAKIFLNEKKTGEMRYGRYSTIDVFTGFTEVLILNAVPNGMRILISGGTHTEVENV